MYRELLVGFAILIIAIAVLSCNTSVKAQNVTNASNLTGIENTTTSATVTARQNASPPDLEPEDYPTLGPADE